MDPLITIAMELYPILCVFFPCLIYLIVVCKKGALQEKGAKKKLIWRFVFLTYLFLVMSVVGMGSIWDIGKFGPIIRPDEINLVLFDSEGPTTYILNMIMFMPLGFLLPLIWENYRKLPKVLLVGFVFSLMIEIGQLFNRRVTDIDDLLMNVLGALVGFLLSIIFSKVYERFSRAHRVPQPKNITLLKDDPFFYIVLSVVGTFFLYNWRWYFVFFE